MVNRGAQVSPQVAFSTVSHALILYGGIQVMISNAGVVDTYANATGIELPATSLSRAGLSPRPDHS